MRCVDLIVYLLLLFYFYKLELFESIFSYTHNPWSVKFFLHRLDNYTGHSLKKSVKHVLKNRCYIFTKNVVLTECFMEALIKDKLTIGGLRKSLGMIFLSFYMWYRYIRMMVFFVMDDSTLNYGNGLSVELG